MPRPDVLVVAEMPSLGSAVYDLLVAGGLHVAQVGSLAEAVLHHAGPGMELPKVVVGAAANRPSVTARTWADGPFASVPLVVVGTPDPLLGTESRVRYVTLPLSPGRLLELVRGLVDRPAVSS